MEILYSWHRVYANSNSCRLSNCLLTDHLCKLGKLTTRGFAGREVDDATHRTATSFHFHSVSSTRLFRLYLPTCLSVRISITCGQQTVFAFTVAPDRTGQQKAEELDAMEEVFVFGSGYVHPWNAPCDPSGGLVCSGTQQVSDATLLRLHELLSLKWGTAAGKFAPEPGTDTETGDGVWNMSNGSKSPQNERFGRTRNVTTKESVQNRRWDTTKKYHCARSDRLETLQQFPLTLGIKRSQYETMS